MKTLVLIILIVGAAGSALAQLAVPEVDPASGVSALAVLTGALLVIRGRRKPR